MDRILRGEAGWQDALVRALAQATRPIRTDARFAPRAAAGESRLPRYDRASFPPARAAATLLLVYPGPRGELTVPLTVRHADLREHAGEISLPGGSVDADDASHEAAALREAEEEIGVAPTEVAIAGVLDDVWIPVSNFELRPYVGMAVERPVLHPRADEVAQIIELPVPRLLAEDAVSEELIEGPGWQLQAAVYRYDGHRIWGATARTLAMFAAVLQEADLRT
ncbi:MAG: NUDIX hydrolase [Candidatus Limnocylindria bacterium]